MTDGTTTSSDASMKKDRTTSSVSSDDQSSSEFNDMDTKSSMSEPKGTVPSSLLELKNFLANWDPSKSNTITLSYTTQLPSNSKSMEKRGVRFVVVEGHVHATFPAGCQVQAETSSSKDFCYSFFHDEVQIGQLIGYSSDQTLEWLGLNPQPRLTPLNI